MWQTTKGSVRRRYQRGQLIRSGEKWFGRWREDVANDTGTIKRVRKMQFLGAVKDLPTKRLAERELERRLILTNSIHHWPNRPISFAIFAQRWIENVLVMQKLSSQSSARSHIRVHLLPAFGERSMADIRTEAIQQFVSASKVSPKMTRNIIVTMMSMWSTAQAWGYVQHNPFPRSASGRLRLRLPAACPVRTYHFSLEEARAIISRAKDPWKTFFRILAETGMRPGELAGLRRDAIGKSSLTVTQSVWGQKLQTPKSDAAMRTIAISVDLAADLDRLVDSAPQTEHGLVFVTSAAKPLSLDNLRQRVLNPILEELGILTKIRSLGARAGCHSFRHMNATLMDTLNTPMKTRQKRLGHAQIATTLKHYSHPIAAEDRRVADALGSLFSRHRNYEESARPVRYSAGERYAGDNIMGTKSPTIAVRLSTPPTRHALGSIYQKGGGDAAYAREKFADAVGNLNQSVMQLQTVLGIQTSTSSNVTGLLALTSGNLSFGDLAGGQDTGNLKTIMVSGTSPVTPNTAFTITHNLGKIPNGFIAIQKDVASDFYGTSGSWNTTTMQLFCDKPSVGFVLLVLG